MFPANEQNRRKSEKENGGVAQKIKTKAVKGGGVLRLKIHGANAWRGRKTAEPSEGPERSCWRMAEGQPKREYRDERALLTDRPKPRRDRMNRPGTGLGIQTQASCRAQ